MSGRTELEGGVAGGGGGGQEAVRGLPRKVKPVHVQQDSQPHLGKLNNEQRTQITHLYQC